MGGDIEHASVAVVGCGIVGIAVAYYLSRNSGVRNVILIDPLNPMSLTSAQSGENYRNWWPQAAMRQFTDDSIGLMEAIARESGDRINMTRRGYSLVTRQHRPHALIDDLLAAYPEESGKVRIHEGGSSEAYRRATSSDWTTAPEGFDVLLNETLIREAFPAYAKDVRTVLHVRRAGSVDGQQLGEFMLEHVRSNGGKVIRGSLTAVEISRPFELAISTSGENVKLRADFIVNAAGPYARDVARLLGEDLAVKCVYQQKISFEDVLGVVPRNLPFTIDLDEQEIAWTAEEKALLAGDPTTAHLAKRMVGGIHCRPDGPDSGKRIKLGWAYNKEPSDPHGPEPIDGSFPDIVLRGASRLQPGLAKYVGRLPRGAHHYGGYYAMTTENWPLIGPMKTPGAFVAAALSGFGTMAACMTGSICADWIKGDKLVPYARALSSERYEDPSLMAELSGEKDRGLL